MSGKDRAGLAACGGHSSWLSGRVRTTLAGAVVAAVTIIGTTTANAAGPAPSDSLDGCTGTHINHVAIDAGSTTIGYLDVYWNSATGYDCALTTSYGPSYGVAKEMWVSVEKCSETTPGDYCDSASPIYTDDDTYRYYAGPKQVYAPNNCIWADGGITWGDSFYTAELGGAADC